MFYYRKALPSALLVTLIVIISQVLTTLANMPENINRHLIFCAALDVIIFLACFFLFRLRPPAEKMDATTVELKEPEL